MWGDLGALSSSLDAVHADLDGVDMAGGGRGRLGDARFDECAAGGGGGVVSGGCVRGGG